MYAGARVKQHASSVEVIWRNMALFQKPARTPGEIAQSRPLGLTPDQVAELDERSWYERAYRGDGVPQLTVRAVLMGSGLGFLLAFTNLYIGLKTGWAMGVAITACILSFALWNGLMTLRLARSPMSILENACMQSTASAAGYSTGTAMASTMPALLMLSVTPELTGGRHLPWPVLAIWTFCLAMLGVFLAIPMKRSLINHERLKFPSGIAAATMLHSLYSRAGEAAMKARVLMVTTLVAGFGPLLMDLRVRSGSQVRPTLLPDSSRVFDLLPAPGMARGGGSLRPSDWTMVLDHKLMMVAAGALIGPRVGLSTLLGGLGLTLVVGPSALARGALTTPDAAWREIGIWIGTPIMVAAGLVAFALQWRTVARAFGALRGAPGSGSDRMRSVEVPTSWFLMGASVAGLGLTWIGHRYLQVPLGYGLIAVTLAFGMSLVACRATGETDITPVGPLGQVTQLAYGVMLPNGPAANLMTGGITAGASISAADLLTDLKSGYLLGANPRRQFMAQLLGIFSGTAATVLGFHLLVPDAGALMGRDGQAPAFPAPGAQANLAVARLLSQGVSHLHPMAQHGMLWGLAAGVALELSARFLPFRFRRFVPSATGIGLGFVLPFQYPLSMAVGGVAAWVWARRQPERADRFVIPLSSGVIAGESIVGVVVAALNNFVL